jgi:hypothetical protein
MSLPSVKEYLGMLKPYLLFGPPHAPHAAASHVHVASIASTAKVVEFSEIKRLHPQEVADKRESVFHVAGGQNSLYTLGAIAIRSADGDVDNWEVFKLPPHKTADDVVTVGRVRTAFAYVVHADAQLVAATGGRLRAGERYVLVNSGSNLVGAVNLADVYLK